MKHECISATRDDRMDERKRPCGKPQGTVALITISDNFIIQEKTACESVSVRTKRDEGISTLASMV